MTTDHCDPATCPNGKCIATGECIEANRPSMQCCNKTVLMRCPGCPYGAPTIARPPLVPTPADYDRLRASKGYRDALAEGLRATTPRTIVAFTGLAGSGKSTAAAHLVNRHGYQRVRFAGPLKSMMAALGCTQEQIEGSEKEVPCELLCGRTPRQAMQWLGTEFGRDLIGPDLWIRAWNAALAKVPAGVPVVVDDCRFPNEAAAVAAAGGVIVRIERPGAGTASIHSSEAHALPAVETLRNIADVQLLQDMVDILMMDLGWRDTSEPCAASASS